MLNKDTAQYLTDAAQQIADSKGFKPASMEALQVWMVENMSEIAKRASELQLETYEKATRPDTFKALSSAMSIKVWSEIRTIDVTRQANQAYNRLFNS